MIICKLRVREKTENLNSKKWKLYNKRGELSELKFKLFWSFDHLFTYLTFPACQT